MKKTMLLILMMLFLGNASYAEEFVSLKEAYADLGIVEDSNDVKKIKEKYIDKSIKWAVTIKGKYKSGKPIFKELFILICNLKTSNIYYLRLNDGGYNETKTEIYR